MKQVYKVVFINELLKEVSLDDAKAALAKQFNLPDKGLNSLLQKPSTVVLKTEDENQAEKIRRSINEAGFSAKIIEPESPKQSNLKEQSISIEEVRTAVDQAIEPIKTGLEGVIEEEVQSQVDRQLKVISEELDQEITKTVEKSVVQKVQAQVDQRVHSLAQEIKQEIDKTAEQTVTQMAQTHAQKQVNAITQQVRQDIAQKLRAEVAHLALYEIQKKAQVIPAQIKRAIDEVLQGEVSEKILAEIEQKGNEVYTKLKDELSTQFIENSTNEVEKNKEEHRLNVSANLSEEVGEVDGGHVLEEEGIDSADVQKETEESELQDQIGSSVPSKNNGNIAEIKDEEEVGDKNEKTAATNVKPSQQQINQVTEKDKASLEIGRVTSALKDGLVAIFLVGIVGMLLLWDGGDAFLDLVGYDASSDARIVVDVNESPASTDANNMPESAPDEQRQLMADYMEGCVVEFHEFFENYKNIDTIEGLSDEVLQSYLDRCIELSAGIDPENEQLKYEAGKIEDSIILILDNRINVLSTVLINGCNDVIDSLVDSFRDGQEIMSDDLEIVKSKCETARSYVLEHGVEADHLFNIEGYELLTGLEIGHSE